MDGRIPERMRVLGPRPAPGAVSVHDGRISEAVNRVAVPRVIGTGLEAVRSEALGLCVACPANEDQRSGKQYPFHLLPPMCLKVEKETTM